MAFAEALKRRPGVWAKLPVDLGGEKATVACAIRKGYGNRAYRGGQFDALHINGQVYIRYVGGVQ
ncbi:hypothetical protein [Micromonospora sp. NPDC048169]|uniref:hypothetical protein n=1 Tax=Micromonospora sp. NPDC048169 TaxID=3154711 RepID=UPI0033CAD5A1